MSDVNDFAAQQFNVPPYKRGVDGQMHPGISKDARELRQKEVSQMAWDAMWRDAVAQFNNATRRKNEAEARRWKALVDVFERLQAGVDERMGQ